MERTAKLELLRDSSGEWVRSWCAYGSRAPAWTIDKEVCTATTAPCEGSRHA